VKTPVKIALIAGLTLLPVGAVVVYGLTKQSDKDGPAASGSGDYKEIDWRLLRQLDTQTGSKPPELTAVDGKTVKIPGFVVPLDDDDKGLSEFLLVPSPQACIHVPPPPPNQMIMIRMKSGAAPQRSWGPVWVKGQINVATMDSQYGKIAYMMRGDSAEPYKMDDSQAN
jgi:hypothetical protein